MYLRIIIGLVFIKRAVWFKPKLVISAVACAFNAILRAHHPRPGKYARCRQKY